MHLTSVTSTTDMRGWWTHRTNPDRNKETGDQFEWLLFKTLEADYIRSRLRELIKNGNESAATKLSNLVAQVKQTICRQVDDECGFEPIVIRLHANPAQLLYIDSGNAYLVKDVNEYDGTAEKIGTVI